MLRNTIDKLKSVFKGSIRKSGKRESFLDIPIQDAADEIGISWDTPTKLSIIWIIFMSILIMFYRSDFLNLMVGISALYFYMTDS